MYPRFPSGSTTSYHCALVLESTCTSVPLAYCLSTEYPSPGPVRRRSVPPRTEASGVSVSTRYTSRRLSSPGTEIWIRGVMAAGTGARRMLPSLSRVHFPYSSTGWTSVSSHSPFSVSVTVQDCGRTTPSPLPEKSVQAAGYTQIMGITSLRGTGKAPAFATGALSNFACDTSIQQRESSHTFPLLCNDQVPQYSSSTGKLIFG